MKYTEAIREREKKSRGKRADRATTPFLLTLLGGVIAVLCVYFACMLWPPIQVSAAEYDEFTYEVHDGKATITGCPWEYNYILDIPPTIDGYPVVAIGSQAFSDYNYAAEVVIPEGVEVIESFAFYQCGNLQEVYLPDSLITIGDKAFCNCKSLEIVHFGENLKTIAYGAFSACRKLDFYLDLPNKLEVIGSGAFYDCDRLETVLLPDSLKELGSKAFGMCDRLDYIYIPDGIPKIGAQVLYCSACYYYSSNWYGDAFYIGSYLLDTKKTLTGKYTVLKGITHIADGAFERCRNMTEVVLPEGLQVIGAGAFENCIGLESIVIPQGVTTIDDEAFYWCDNLADIQLPDSVTYIGEAAFERTAFYKNAENWDNGVLYAGSCLVSCQSSVSGVLQVRQGTKTIVGSAMKDRTKLTEVILPDTVTSIGENAFYGCSRLTSVSLGKDISHIGAGAFGQCGSLETITVDPENETYCSQGNCLIRRQDRCLVMGCKGSKIPRDGSVTSIGDYAFEGCAGLTEITIPDEILYIGVGAFRDCNNLTTMHLGNGVQIVGERAFAECDRLSHVDFGQSVHTIEGWGFAYNHGLKQLELPTSLQHLGEEAFSNSTGLVSVTFREGLMTIGKNCFAYSENLTSLCLPDSLQEIKEGAFYTCTKIKTVTFGRGLVTIGDSAFDGCFALTAVNLPDSIQTLGTAAFYECKNLTQVDLGRVQKIGRSAFESCTALKQIHIPATVTSMGKQVFSYCTAMEQMTVSRENPYYHSRDNCIINTAGKYLAFGCKNSVIPADGSVTSVDGYAFAGCRQLKRIVVPDNVTRIGAYAFYDCSGLEYMKLPFVGGAGSYDNYIGYIFGGGPSQNDLFVPATLTRIEITGGKYVGDSGFSKCNGLQELILPESITSIGYGAFANCGKLTRVIVPGDLEAIKSSDIFSGSGSAKLYISAGQENTKALAEANNIPYQLGGMITFVDDRGQQIEKKWYFLGGKISVPTVAEKPADDNCTYEIAWEPVPDSCTGNQTIRLRYIAHWIGGQMPGDLTGDGKLNSLDGLLLMRYLNGWDVNVGSAGAMDVNGDGKVNSLDGLILMRYLNGWNVTLG